jgi:hypothetical protein
LLPFIGHTGICGTNGLIHDFAGSYTISINDMAFGDPIKYVKLDIPDSDESEKQLDIGIMEADVKFKSMTHSLITNNCHSH